MFNKYSNNISRIFSLPIIRVCVDHGTDLFEFCIRKNHLNLNFYKAYQKGITSLYVKSTECHRKSEKEFFYK